ncbi:MAG: tyrosine-type recombinase/integrase [Sulfurovum sp.]
MKLEIGEINSDYARWLKSYMRHLKYKDVSQNTLILYTRILNELQKFISEEKSIEMLKNIDKEFFLDFVEYREERSKNGHFAKKTKQLYISILKSFFVYISDNNDEFYTFENEFKISIKGANKAKKIKYLIDEEVVKIANYIEERTKNRGTRYDYIYALGIKLMLFGGLRISEVLALRLRDITISDLTDDNGKRDIYEIHLKETKSGEEQTALVKIVDIENELEYFDDLLSANDYIFVNPKNQNLIHRSNYYIGVKKIMQKAGVDKKGLHIYRHTCAMQLYRKSRDILVTKEKLRHSDIKTTMIYAKAEKNDIAKAMR